MAVEWSVAGQANSVDASGNVYYGYDSAADYLQVGAWATRSWSGAALVTLQTPRGAELAAARARGTSALPEHLALLSVAQLESLAADKRVAPGFVAQIEQALAARKQGG